MCPFDICRNHRHAKFPREQTSTALERPHLAVRRSCAFGVQNQTASGFLQESAASRQTVSQRLGPRLAVDWYDVHQCRDRPAHASGVKKVVAGTEQSEAAKAAPAGGHQRRAVSMAGVIAAEQKRSVGKVMSSLHRERTAAGEEHPAKTFKHRTADCWCLEHANIARARHYLRIHSGMHSLRMIAVIQSVQQPTVLARPCRVVAGNAPGGYSNAESSTPHGR